MKFTKEDALKKIQEVLGKTTYKQKLSDRTITEALENLIPLVATDEMEIDEFVNKVAKSFESMNANIGNDVSAEIKKQLDVLKPPATPPATPANPATPATPATPAVPTDDNAKVIQEAIAAAMKPVMESLKVVQEETAAVKAEKASVELRDKLIAAAEVKHGKKFVKEFLDDVQDLIDFKSEGAESLFNSSLEKRVLRTGHKFTVGDEKADMDKDIDWSAEKKRKQEQGLLPKEDKK